MRSSSVEQDEHTLHCGWIGKGLCWERLAEHARCARQKELEQGFRLQGMLGETYDRFIAGDAANTKSSPLYLPDDGQFHGIGKRAQYKMDNYWDTNHVSTCLLLNLRIQASSSVPRKREL